uniref:Chaperonin GroEL n=1 Tax=Apophlaea sinclairii TaxID=212746 RepID=A0A1C9CBT4_9FLOR|nr:chaperonin GroEL [Apophlaea sinclairii]AOM65835.1 chaperonin GroEL [Apophlaea sinclairii]
MSTRILYKKQARDNLISGIKTVAKVVSTTLGPLSHNVLLHKCFKTPQVINHGFTIINEIEFDNFVENIGIKLIRQAVAQTNNIAGDGTTTTIIIAYNLIYRGMQCLMAGSNVTDIIKGINMAINFLNAQLIEYAQPIKNTIHLEKIATLASDGNSSIGTAVADIVEQIGPEGTISLEESRTTATTIEITKGIKLNKGLVSPLFMKNTKTIKIIKNNPYILITNKKINLVQEELIPILELVSQTQRPLIIFAQDISTEALSTLVINYLQNITNAIVVKIPGFGSQRELITKDISVATNSKVIDNKNGLELHQIQISMLGEADKVFIDANSTIIISNHQQRRIHKYCNQLRKQINTSSTTYEKESLKNRLANIYGKTAIIKLGSVTRGNLQDLKLQFKKALSSVQMSIEEGTVAGGGKTYLRLASELSSWANTHLYKDQLTGAQLVKECLMIPFHKILQNAGGNYHNLLKTLETNKVTTDYNISNGQSVDLYKNEIIDSAKVLRLILQNATSITKMFLKTECLIVNKQSIKFLKSCK